MESLTGFIDLLRNRHSCRRYSTTMVEDEKIQYCCEAMRLAPSACNKQPWRLTVVRDAGLRGEIADKALLPGIPMAWVKSAPVILALGIETEFLTHKVATWFSKIDYPYLDAGIAGQQLVLAAEEAGLKSCWIGWFKPEKVREILGLPTQRKVVALLTLGYPEEGWEGAAASRKEISEIVEFR